MSTRLEAWGDCEPLTAEHFLEAYKNVVNEMIKEMPESTHEQLKRDFLPEDDV